MHRLPQTLFTLPSFLPVCPYPSSSPPLTAIYSLPLAEPTTTPNAPSHLNKRPHSPPRHCTFIAPTCPPVPWHTYTHLPLVSAPSTVSVPRCSPAPRIQHSRSPALPLHHPLVVPHLSQCTHQLTTHPCAPPLCPGAPHCPGVLCLSHGAQTLARPKHTHPHCLCAAALTLLFSACLAEFTTCAFSPSHKAQFSFHPVAAMPT